MSSRLLYFLIVSIVWLLIGIAILPPFVGESSSSFIVLIFDRLCHQLPGRSIHLHGESLAVCARCICIYFGIGLSLLLYPRMRNQFKPSIKLLAFAAGLMTLQWLAEWMAPSEIWLIARMVTGLFFGLFAGVFLAKAIFELNTTPSLNYKLKDELKLNR